MVKIFAALSLLFLASCAEIPKTELFDSNVKITLSNGKSHGSGTYIGNGYFLTAGHVITDDEKFVIETKEGQFFEGEKIWSNMKYDVGLIHVDIKIDNLQIHNIDCRLPVIGEEITTVGSPYFLSFVETKGTVTLEKVDKIGPWNEVFVSDITALPGNSGGPVFDKEGDVIGIIVGLTGAENPQTGMIMPIGFTYIVPSTTICKLMNIS